MSDKGKLDAKKEIQVKLINRKTNEVLLEYTIDKDQFIYEEMGLSEQMGYESLFKILGKQNNLNEEEN